ncbi:ribonuclease H-like domain-containing protein [Tanacetum coccineum]
MLARSMAAKLTAASASECLFANFLSEIEPKRVSKALKHPEWVDEQTRLVAQGFSQEEGTDYDETFTLVARMESIRIFLAFATYMNFIVFQMDVKSAFLNGKLKEEFYVKQPSGFESSEFFDYVCKLDKALYGLKQAPRAWMQKPYGKQSRPGLEATKYQKKMQKTILKQQYENFAASRSEGLDKTYNRFQKLISQLEINSEVYEAEIKGQSSSSSNSQNVAFVYLDNTSSTNKAVNTAHDVFAASSQGQASSSTYVDDVMFPFFDNQYNSPQLDNEDLEQIDTDDHEEMDLKWQVVMLTMRGNRNRDNTRRVVPVVTPANALVVTDGMGYDWSYQAEEGPTDFALMAHSSSGSSSSSSSNTEVRDNTIIELKNQLEEALKEKDDLKLKLEKFETSSKKLTKLINSQISVNNKTGVGFDSQINENELHDSHLNKSEVSESASDSSVNESKEHNNQVNDRYKAGEGYHAVPPPYTGNFMPPRPDLSFAGLDDYVFKSAVNKSVTSVHESETSASKISKESMEKPKSIRSSAPIIEDWESDSDDDCEIRSSIKQNKSSCAKINFVKSNENTRKHVIEQHTYRQAKNLRKKKPVLNNEGKATGQREVRLVSNNAHRVNHQNFSNNLTHPHPRRNFVPSAVMTKSGQVPVSAAKQSSSRAATLISTTRPINTAVPKLKVNDALPRTYSYFQAHSSIRRPINKRIAITDINFNKKVNTAKVNYVTTVGPKTVVSAAGGNGENAVKSSACWI